MKTLVPLFVLAFLASGCATGDMLAKRNIVELGKSLKPGDKLYYTKVTEVEILEVYTKGTLDKKPAKKPKNKKALPIIRITEGR